MVWELEIRITKIKMTIGVVLLQKVEEIFCTCASQFLSNEAIFVTTAGEMLSYETYKFKVCKKEYRVGLWLRTSSDCPKNVSFFFIYLLLISVATLFLYIEYITSSYSSFLYYIIMHCRQPLLSNWSLFIGEYFQIRISISAVKNR